MFSSRSRSHWLWDPLSLTSFNTGAAYYYYFPLAEVYSYHLGDYQNKDFQLKDSLSSKDNLRPLVWPSQANVISKTKEIEKNRSYYKHTRTSWMANNAYDTGFDYYEYDMLKFGIPVEPKRSTEVGSTSKNNLRILNTINPLTGFKSRPYTKPVSSSELIPMDPSVHFSTAQTLLLNDIKASDPSQVTRGDKLKFKSAYKMKID
jgi:hypothetical protein